MTDPTSDGVADSPTVGASGPLPRRTFLAGAGVLATSALVAPRLRGAPSLIGRARRTSPIKHVIISCQENHSFDHWFGSYAALPSGYGIPAGWTNSGVAPFPFADTTGDGVDPLHDWTRIHDAYADGTMTGFVSNGNGPDAMGYYTSGDIPFYYSLLEEYTLCAEYFSGVLGSSLSNVLTLYSGTCGGLTYDVSPAVGTLDWPCLTHLLDLHGVSYKNYNLHATIDASPLAFWKGNAKRAVLNQSSTAFYRDCARGTLPQVSFLTREPPYDEHPPADVRTGQWTTDQIISALKKSRSWEHSVILHTYDEGGGYFDHRPPQELDAFGSGIRVPLVVVSPLAKRGHVDTTYSDHASILKFIEHVYGLPTLASINHLFDHSTPSSAGQGGGAPFPPRDANPALSNLTQCFTVDV